MKIAYLDLNQEGHYETYAALNPRAYGGARSLPVALRESNLVDCDIYSDQKSFEDCIYGEKLQNNFVLPLEQRLALRSGAFVDLKEQGYDIVVHHFTDVFVNTNIPQCIWALGFSESVHPSHKNLALYNRFQNPRIYNLATNVSYFILGCDIPKEAPNYTKGDFLFHCGRNTRIFGNIEMAKFCLKFGIKCYFGGPTDKDYPLLDYIDNKNTFYLGQITEQEKIDYTKKALATFYLHSWPTPMSLSALQSLAYGTPIIATNVGFWPSLVLDGVNGFLINGTDESSILRAWSQIGNINPKDCWQTVQKYSTESMVESFVKILEGIT